MFKAGPSGKLDAEAKAFVFLKMFYEGTASLPYVKNWNKKVKGPNESNIPITINEDSEDDEWVLNGDEEEEGDNSLYTNIDIVRDTDNEQMEENSERESFWYYYARGNKPAEQTTELAVTLIEGDLTIMRRNLENLHEVSLLQISQVGSPDSPQTSTQVPVTEKTKENMGLFQVEEEAIEKLRENDNILDTKEQVELLQQYLDSVKTTGNTAEINKCMGQLLNLKKKYSEITGGIEIY